MDYGDADNEYGWASTGTNWARDYPQEWRAWRQIASKYEYTCFEDDPIWEILCRLDECPGPDYWLRQITPGKGYRPENLKWSRRRARLPRPEVQVESPYLTSRQAAAYLNIAYGTFRNWATQIDRTKTRRYTRENLDKFARTRRK